MKAPLVHIISALLRDSTVPPLVTLWLKSRDGMAKKPCEYALLHHYIHLAPLFTKQANFEITKIFAESERKICIRQL